MKQVYTLCKVGTDAELFLMKDRQPFPVIGLLGGTKHEPKPVIDYGFAVQEDNVMAEFNVPPASNATEFDANITRMMSWLKAKFKKDGFDLKVAASMLFPEAMLDHPQAQTFGCEPDFNVWLRKANVSPRGLADPCLRTAAAHLHVSFKLNGKDLTNDVFEREPVVKAMDICVGLPSVLLDPDKKRRQMYGKAGSFRSKPYGIEHRVASNFWIRSKELRQWAFNATVKAIELCNKKDGTWLKSAVTEYGDTIRNAIDSHDQGTSSALLQHFGIYNMVAPLIEK